ncbi:putative cytochrome P450 [Corynespora cassiicola Philippines]|uniref:Putative cytochrome P450 n=1 Tax=Corynespora cassiicola Philippines TaxID=1448308 RepID=A0A2T2P5R3_CORCC|nr:putative cytochrome P450 [Corynespora cassiicola Philippines]
MFTYILLGFAIFYGIYRLRLVGSRPAGLPPGPPTEPIFGNLRQMPKFSQWNRFIEWGRQYGPVLSIMKGSRPYVIVNDPEAARELFVKLGQSSSGRLNSHTELAIRGGNNYPMSDGPLWRVARRQWHSMLNVASAKKYLPYQTLEATKLMCDMLESPQDFQRHVPRYSNSVSLSMTEGYRVASSDDPVVAKTLAEFDNFAVYLQAADWANFFPLLWKLPTLFSPPKKQGWNVYQSFIETNWNRFLKSKTSDLPSFYQVIGQAQQSLGISDEQALSMGESLLLAGTETTATSVRAWLAAMALFPEKQRKAQEEIDRVIGNDRLPGDGDAVNLVYVRQMVQELHRWATVAPLGITHAASKPIEWRGYTIPQGAGLIYNTMAIHFNEERYPEPQSFVPERWEGKLEMAAENSVGVSSELFTFGAGRRICPGQHLAERSIFLVISNFLWAFEISQAVDADGKKKPIRTDETKPGIARAFPEFEVSIKPRSEERARIIEETWSQMKDEFLDENEQWKTAPDGFKEIVQKAKAQSRSKN